MRKLVTLLVVFTIACASAFADEATITWSADMYGGLGIASDADGTTFQAYNYDWVGAGGQRLYFTAVSADQNVGFNTKINMANPSDSATSNPSLNIKRFNVYGKLFDGIVTVRGGILGDYSTCPQVWNDYGNLDGRFGVALQLTPFEGFNIQYFKAIPWDAEDISFFLDPAKGSSDVLGAMYKAKDIGYIVAGAIFDLSDGADFTYYAGGGVTAIKNVTFDVEVKLHESTFEALESVSYTMGALSVASYIGEGYDGTDFTWGVEPSIAYKLSDSVSIKGVGNVYNSAGGTARTWMSPVDAGVLGAAADGTIGGGAGVSASYSFSGMKITVGDYYSLAGDNSANAIYLNYFLKL